MARVVALGSLILICFGSLCCSSYTKGLQQSVARADEVTAVTALKTISVAQQAYSVSNDGAYAGFVQLVQGGYLDSRFNSETPKIKGYVFTMTTSPRSGATPDFFSCNADPSNTGETAGRHLYIDSSSPEVKVNATQPASASDPTFMN